MSTQVFRPSFASSPFAVLAWLAVTVLFFVGIARISGRQIEVFDIPIVSSLAIQFEDRADGTVAIIDATTGSEAARLQGEQGFARGVLRALVRERKRQGLGHQIPFLLQSHSDGSLTLRDPATGQTIHLDSFGPDQKAVFSKLQPKIIQSHEGNIQ